MDITERAVVGSAVLEKTYPVSVAVLLVGFVVIGTLGGVVLGASPGHEECHFETVTERTIWMDRSELVGPGSERTVDVDLQAGDRMTVHAENLVGVRPIVTVYDPDGIVLHESPSQPHTEETFLARQVGTYTVEFSNPHSSNSGTWTMTVTSATEVTREVC